MKGWPVTRKEVLTREGEEMEFFTFEDKTGIFETVFFPKPFRRFCQDLDMSHAYLLHGLVESEFDRLLWSKRDAAGNGRKETGNTPIEALMIEYMSLRGQSDGMDTMAITDMAEYFERELGHQIPSNYPLVGRDSNTTSAGIHVDGALKNEEIYNIFDTMKIFSDRRW